MESPKFLERVHLSGLPRLHHTGAPTEDVLPSGVWPNFARQAKWSPDGLAALSQCENGAFEYIVLPDNSADNELTSNALLNSPNAVKDKVFQQAAPILDFAWYPRAAVSDPASFCFLASIRECPVKLLNASDGRLRASYRIVDHRERQIAPHSISFTPIGDKIYCGFENAIEIFDLHYPGEGFRLHTTPSKKTKDGLKGIISALAFATTYPTSMFAAGSLAASNANIALIDAESEKIIGYPCPTADVNVGVSQLAFNPSKPYHLYASYRRSNKILEWDLRGDINAPTRTFQRQSAGTNQRMRFDINIGGQYLATGDENGQVLLYDLSESSEPSILYDVGNSGREIQSAMQWQAHSDGIGSVSFNPTCSSLLSVSGSRHFSDHKYEETSSDEPLDNEDNQDKVDNLYRIGTGPIVFDNSIKLWNWN